MVFLLRLLKGVRVKNKCKKYFEIKRMTLEDLKRKHGIYARIKNFFYRKFPILFGLTNENQTGATKFEEFQINLITTGTFENFAAKSIIGFVGGVLLTYILFALFVLLMNIPLSTSTFLCSVLGCILTLGLAFSTRVRCIVLMILPQFFSKRGRQALIGYAFILVLTGPAKNTLYNVNVLSETMACSQEKLKMAVKNLVDMIKTPFAAIKDTMEQVAEKVKVVVKKVKDMIDAITRTIKALIGVIKTAYDWLNSVVSICSKKLGTPYERCTKAFEEAVVDCKDKLGSMFSWMCSTAYLASNLCYAVKMFDYVCDLIDFVSDEIVTQVKKKLDEFKYKVKNIFYVKIEFSHSFSYAMKQSRSFKEIAANMMNEISARTKKIASFFSWMSFGFTFFFIFMVLKAMNYRRKFLASDAFDNHYITDKIKKLDIRRTELGRETILPLNIHERKKYAMLSSLRLVQSERKVIARSAIFLTLSTIKMIIHIVIDYSLYWILDMLRLHGQYETYIDAPSSLEVKVDGNGMLPELYGSVLNAFQPTNVNMDVDTAPCLPNPRKPNTFEYKQILAIMGLAWLLSFTEPYGLRLRFLVMSYYNPERAEERAVWLYNNIIRARGSFLKFARRQLRRKFAMGTDDVEQVSLMDRLRARCPLLRKIWKGKVFKACLLCGSLGSEKSPLIKCPRECVGLYCISCYAMLQNLCTICRLPIEYGDLSDVSEERDSSEEGFPRKSKKSLAYTSESSGELNLTEALLPTDTDTELSYGYQYKERDPSERMEIPLENEDVEPPKPIERATIDQLSSSNMLSSGERRSLTLAERRNSGILDLILGDGNELRRRTVSSTGRRGSRDDDENDLHNGNKQSRRSNIRFGRICSERKTEKNMEDYLVDHSRITSDEEVQETKPLIRTQIDEVEEFSRKSSTRSKVGFSPDASAKTSDSEQHHPRGQIKAFKKILSNIFKRKKPVIEESYSAHKPSKGVDQSVSFVFPNEVRVHQPKSNALRDDRQKYEFRSSEQVLSGDLHFDSGSMRSKNARKQGEFHVYQQQNPNFVLQEIKHSICKPLKSLNEVHKHQGEEMEHFEKSMTYHSLQSCQQQNPHMKGNIPSEVFYSSDMELKSMTHKFDSRDLSKACRVFVEKSAPLAFLERKCLMKRSCVEYNFMSDCHYPEIASKQRMPQLYMDERSVSEKKNIDSKRGAEEVSQVSISHFSKPSDGQYSRSSISFLEKKSLMKCSSVGREDALSSETFQPQCSKEIFPGLINHSKSFLDAMSSVKCSYVDEIPLKESQRLPEYEFQKLEKTPISKCSKEMGLMERNFLNPSHTQKSSSASLFKRSDESFKGCNFPIFSNQGHSQSAFAESPDCSNMNVFFENKKPLKMLDTVEDFVINENERTPFKHLETLTQLQNEGSLKRSIQKVEKAEPPTNYFQAFQENTGEEGPNFMKKVSRDPAMVKHWVKTGKYHTPPPPTARQHSSFLDKFWYLNPFRLSEYWSRSEPAFKLYQQKKKNEIRKRLRQNVERERRKKESKKSIYRGKPIRKKSNLGLETDSSSSSS